MSDFLRYIYYGLRNLATVAVVAATSVSVYYLLKCEETAEMTNDDLDNQSMVHEDGYRYSPLLHKLNDGQLTISYYDDVTTLYEGFLRGLRVSENGPCLGTRWERDGEYQWISYQAVYEEAMSFGSGLLAMGLSTDDQSRLGIYSKNRQEWVFAELAAYMYSLVTVPFQDTHDRDYGVYIINFTEMQVIVCDTEKRARKLLNNASKLPRLQTIVVMDDLSTNLIELVTTHAIKVVTFQDVQMLGEQSLTKPSPPASTDIATICFTSGTTGGLTGVTTGVTTEGTTELNAPKGEVNNSSGCHGCSAKHMFKKVFLRNQTDSNDAPKCGIGCPCYTKTILKKMFVRKPSTSNGAPKGVMLTHGNIVANYSALLHQVETCFKIGDSDCHLSYLPLSHTYERIVQAMYFVNGSSIGFFSGNNKHLFDDLQALKPKVFCTVPRMVDEIRDKMYAVASTSALKRFILELAMRQKTACLKRGVETKDSIWDWLVFSKIQEMLGGQVKFVITASAPLSLESIEFLTCATGAKVIQVYGQTECTAAATSNVPGNHSKAHVGSPLTCNYIKLKDVPELNYYSRDNHGEICIKGANVFRGYYKDRMHTEEVKDRDGWLHTGDIGEWLPSGALNVIDRKKNIFKLSQGEYVSPEKIEQIYTLCPLVAQAFVDGFSLKRYCMGIVVPDPDTVMPLAERHGLPCDMKQICQSKEVKDIILKAIRECGQRAFLNQFEQVKDIVLHHKLFSMDNGLLTPMLKAKRGQLREFFKDQFEALYEENPY